MSPTLLQGPYTRTLPKTRAARDVDFYSYRQSNHKRWYPLRYLMFLAISCGYNVFRRLLASTACGCHYYSWLAEQRQFMIPCTLSRLIIWFGQTRPEVSSRVSPRVLHILGWISCSPLGPFPPPPPFCEGDHRNRQASKVRWQTVNSPQNNSSYGSWLFRQSYGHDRLNRTTKGMRATDMRTHSF